MASRPPIPERYSSLVPPSDRKDVEILTKRSVSAMTTMSQLSTTSSVDSFIDAKIESISADIALNSELKDYFQSAKKRKALNDEQYDDAIQELAAEVNQKERELITLKRQKKIIVEDIDDALPYYSTIEGAYSSIMTAKIMSASKQKQRKKFDQGAFAKAVLSFYGAKRLSETQDVEKYCHLTGWQPEKYVKCAHLVPKSLESDDLNYLFGVRETILSEARNGITLNHVIEGGLDDGRIVIVPDKPNKGEETIWRCILVDQSKASGTTGVNGLRWRDIDGKALQFLTINRPARRYLYLRYVITYLHQQKLGNLEWLSRVKARGYLWATPGAYLRKTMLLTLARRVSDHFLPEVFYDSTFDNADGCPKRSAEEEEDLVISFDHKMQDALAEKSEEEEEEEEEEEDSD